MSRAGPYLDAIGQADQCGLLKNQGVELLANEDYPQWDAFVAKHALGSIYHTTGWKKVVESTFRHICGHFLVVRNSSSGEIQSGLPVYLVRSKLLRNRLVSVPFATFADPLVGSEKDWRFLMRALQQLANASRSKSIELRTVQTPVSMFAGPVQSKSIYKHHRLALTTDPEAIKATFSRTAVRRMIAKAEKADMRVERRQGKEDFEAFYWLLTRSRRRLGLPPLPWSLFQSMMRHLDEKNICLWVAVKDTRTIGAALTLVTQKRCCLEYAGDLPEYRNLGVGQLLYWTSIQHACAAGCIDFSFGRTLPDDEGLLAYKRHWGTREEDLVYIRFTEKILRNKTKINCLAYSLVRHLFQTVPFPVYRALGAVFYSHWG